MSPTSKTVTFARANILVAQMDLLLGALLREVRRLSVPVASSAPEAATLLPHLEARAKEARSKAGSYLALAKAQADLRRSVLESAMVAGMGQVWGAIAANKAALEMCEVVIAGRPDATTLPVAQVLASMQAAQDSAPVSALATGVSEDFGATYEALKTELVLESKSLMDKFSQVANLKLEVSVPEEFVAALGL